jgi:hypothetical protein
MTGKTPLFKNGKNLLFIENGSIVCTGRRGEH